MNKEVVVNNEKLMEHYFGEEMVEKSKTWWRKPETENEQNIYEMLLSLNVEILMEESMKISDKSNSKYVNQLCRIIKDLHFKTFHLLSSLNSLSNGEIQKDRDGSISSIMDCVDLMEVE